MFGDDPELLALLADQDAGAASAPPPEPYAPERTPTAPLTRESEKMDEPAWQTMMLELDQLLATASDPPPPILPPPHPSIPQETFFPPEPEPPLADTDDEAPLVIGKAVSFDLGDLMSPPSDPPRETQPFPFPFDDQPLDDFFNDNDIPGKKPEEQPPVARSRAKRIAGIVFNVLFVLLCLTMVIGSAMFALSSDENKSYLGYRFFNVLSDSMTPQPGGAPGGFVKGDIVIVKVVIGDEKARAEIRVGDIITMHNPDTNTYLSHRVVEILEQSEGVDGLFFVTRGDTNNTDDAPVQAGRVVGKVVLVLPKMGSALEYVRQNLLLVIVFIVAFITFVILLRNLLISGTKKRKKNRQRPIKNLENPEGSGNQIE